MSDETYLSIIIPVFNEQNNITQLYQNLKQVLEKLPYSYEIIMVDDGSQDATLETIQAILQHDQHCKALSLRRNYGQTAAMMAGFDHSQGEIIIPMDGDLQNSPDDIPRLLEKIDQGYDVCSGWRKNRKDKRFSRRIPSQIANYIISKISGVHLHDYGCSLKAYRKEILKEVRLYGEMHRFIPIYASWSGAKITEITVTHYPRSHGQSKYGLNRTFKVILDLIVVKFLSDYATKPIYIFGGFGLLNIFCALMSFILMLSLKFAQGVSFILTPLPILSVFFFIMGFFSILLGLLAEIMVRIYHESQSKPVYTIRHSYNFKSNSNSID